MAGPKAAAPVWHVSRGALRAPDGRAVLLRGVNVASAHKRPPYFGFHRARDFLKIRQDWGMNAVRLLVTWAAIEPERGRYDTDYLKRLEQRLEWAHEARLWVVLDMHQDLYGEGFGGNGAPRWTSSEAAHAAFTPTEPWFFNYLNDQVVASFDAFWRDSELQERYLDAWRQLAARFADHPAVVGFDPMNEPFWGTTEVTYFESRVLQPFYERAVAAVRELAPGWVAFVEPCSSRNLGVPTSLTPFSFDNVVYAPHSYDLGAEAGHGFDSLRHNALTEAIAELHAEARRLGAALCIGEYGGRGDDPSIAEYMDAEYAGIGQVAGGSMYWAYDRDSGYGLLDTEGNEKTRLLDALVRPYPRLVNGDPVSISFDRHTKRFRFIWTSAAAGHLPSEISVPARVYPEGYQARFWSGESAEFEVQVDRLLVKDAPPGRLLTLELEPARTSGGS